MWLYLQRLSSSFGFVYIYILYIYKYIIYIYIHIYIYRILDMLFMPPHLAVPSEIQTLRLKYSTAKRESIGFSVELF